MLRSLCGSRSGQAVTLHDCAAGGDAGGGDQPAEAPAAWAFKCAVAGGAELLPGSSAFLGVGETSVHGGSAEPLILIPVSMDHTGQTGAGP